jgi:hypothetical protein
MVTTFSMAILNPVIGYFADVNLYWTFVVLGVLLLGVTILIVPRESELDISSTKE